MDNVPMTTVNQVSMSTKLVSDYMRQANKKRPPKRPNTRKYVVIKAGGRKKR